MATATLTSQSATDVAEIRSVIEKLHRAHHDKNASAIATAYAGDATLFTLAPPLAYHGVDLKEKQAWLDSWDGPIDLESKDLEVTVSGDSAFCFGYVQMKGTPKMAGREISFWMRVTACLHREGDAWKIIHQHESVPFYMDGTQRAAFDLKPNS
jgi:ketosteroid isomerase-like protein